SGCLSGSPFLACLAAYSHSRSGHSGCFADRYSRAVDSVRPFGSIARRARAAASRITARRDAVGIELSVPAAAVGHKRCGCRADGSRPPRPSCLRRAQSCPIAAVGGVGAERDGARGIGFPKLIPTQTAQTADGARLQNRLVPPSGGRKVRLLPLSANSAYFAQGWCA